MENKKIAWWFILGQVIVLITFLYAMFGIATFVPETVFQEQLIVFLQIKWFLVAIFLELGQIAILIANKR